MSPDEPDDPPAIGPWVQGTRAVVRIIRALTDDATLRQGERVHSRRYLRRMLMRRLRELEARLDAIDSAAAGPPPAVTPPAT